MKTEVLYEPRSKSRTRYAAEVDFYRDTKTQSPASPAAPRPSVVIEPRREDSVGKHRPRPAALALYLFDVSMFAVAACILIGASEMVSRMLFFGLELDDETLLGRAFMVTLHGGPQAVILAIAAVLLVTGSLRWGWKVRSGARVASVVLAGAWLLSVAGGMLYLRVEQQRWNAAGIGDLGQVEPAIESNDPKNAPSALLSVADWVQSQDSGASMDMWDAEEHTVMIPVFRSDSRWPAAAAKIRAAVADGAGWNWKVIPEINNDYRGASSRRVIQAVHDVLTADIAEAMDSGDRDRAILDLVASQNIVQHAGPTKAYFVFEECLRVCEEDSRIAVSLFKDDSKGFEKVKDAFKREDFEEWARSALAVRPHVYDELCEFREPNAYACLPWKGFGEGVKLAMTRERAASRAGVAMYLWDTSALHSCWDLSSKACIDRSDRAQCNDVMVKLALNRLDMLVIELNQYRRDHGAFPDRLGQLGSVPTDPFNGKPLQYQIAGDEAHISSVGTYRLQDFPARDAQVVHDLRVQIAQRLAAVHANPFGSGEISQPIAPPSPSESPNRLRQVAVVIGADGTTRPY